MIALLSAVTAAFGCMTYLSPVPWRYVYMQAVRKQVRQRRQLILTYDDGPSATVTPHLLDLLRDYDAKATFFMLGRSARQYPTIADRVIREGHDAGCHSCEHLNAWKVSPWRAVADIESGYQELSRWVPSNGIFRPPYGKLTLATYLAVRRRQASLWWWTIDARDTHKNLPQPQELGEVLLRQGGGIVLMHDLAGSKERDSFVLETTALLLRIAREQSYQVCRVSDLCGKR